MQVHTNPKSFFFATVLASLGLGACASSGVSADAFAPEKLQAASQAAEAAGLRSARFLFSANVNGETEPCGCAVNPKGGLDRRFNYVDQSRKSAKEPLFLADAGNAFLPGLQLDPSKTEFFKARAKALARGHASFGLLVHNVGAFDLGLGVAYLKSLGAEAGLKLVSANWVDAAGQRLFDASVTVQEAGVSVTYIGVSAGREAASLSEASVSDPAAAVSEVLKKVPADHIVVLLSDLGVARDRELWSQLDRPAIIVGAKDLSSLEIPLIAGRALFVQPQLQGQQWVDLLVKWRPNAEGWYSNDLAQKFSERWKTLQVRKQERIDQSELAQIRQSESDLGAYAPRDPAKKAFFGHRLVDMTTAWYKRNALSAEMAKVK